eukprot:gene21953-24891_t
MDTIKMNHRAELDAARLKKDTFTLWNLIRNACERLAKTKVRELEEAFNKALHMAGKVLTEREKALHLVDRCNLEDIRLGYQKILTLDREGEKYPSYEKIVERMSLYHLNASQNTEVKKETKGTREDKDSKGRKRNRDETTGGGEKQSDFIKVMQAKIEESLTKKYGWTPVKGKKVKTDSPTTETGPSARPLTEAQKAALAACICWNCKMKGHLTHKCTKAKTKCDKCGKSGHFGEYCEPATAATERYEATKKARKPAHGRSLKVIADEMEADSEPEVTELVEHKVSAARVVHQTILQAEG